MNNKLIYIVAGASLLIGGMGSIAIQTFAAQQAAAVTPAPIVQTQQQSNQVEPVTATDTDNIQNQVNDGKPDTTIEVKGVESPETGSSADKEAPGGHEDVNGVNADHQFDGVE